MFNYCKIFLTVSAMLGINNILAIQFVISFSKHNSRIHPFYNKKLTISEFGYVFEYYVCIQIKFKGIIQKYWTIVET